jgi:hypothetical protein
MNTTYNKYYTFNTNKKLNYSQTNNIFYTF